jgi:hypothetical protein
MINKALLKEEAIKLLKEDGHTDVAYAKRKMILIIDLPSWWMGKVTMAYACMNKVRDYLLTSNISELDVRKVHGDKKIENPKTGNTIKLSSALKAPKGTAVYNKARSMYKSLKEK